MSIGQMEKLGEENRLLFEGIVSFRAVVESGSRKIERLFYDEQKLRKNAKEFGYLKAKSVEHGFFVTLCDRETLNGMALGQSHGGLLFTCAEREIPRVTEEDLPPRGFFVLLDGIEDPYNFGFALRSLYAAGADGVLLPERSWMTAAGVVCRASAGASERMRLFRYDENRLAGLFHGAGYRIVCAEMEHSLDLYESDLRLPLLLAVGGEKRGISASLLEMADLRVRLPYGRDFPAALSAASAATVIGFEILRRNRE